MTQSLADWIKNKEGLRLKPYPDTHGFTSIGYGHNLSMDGIPIAVCEQLLEIDIAEAKKDVGYNLAWVLKLDQARQDAFYHLCFWIGIGSLLGFIKMLDAAKAGDWKTAADELTKSQLYDEIPERTEEIANHLLNGDTL